MGGFPSSEIWGSGIPMRESRSPSNLSRTRGRTPQRTTLVVCEGETEASYLREYCRINHVAGVTSRAAGQDPARVVGRAREGRREGYDAVWAVFDRDEHKTIGRAMIEAKAHGVSVAISFPCFEVFLLAHLQDLPLFAETARKVTDQLKKIDVNYDKSRFDAKKYVSLTSQAEDRCRRQLDNICQIPELADYKLKSWDTIQATLLQQADIAPLYSFFPHLLEHLRT